MKAQITTEHDELTELQNKNLTMSGEKQRADKAEAELEKLKEQIAKEHNELTEQQEKILELKHIEKRAEKAEAELEKLKELPADLEAARSESTVQSERAQKAEADLDKIRKQVESEHSELTTLQTDILKMRGEADKAAQKIENLKESLDDAKVELKYKNKDTDQIKKLEAELIESKKVGRRLQNQVDKGDKAVVKAQEQVKEAVAELNELQEQMMAQSAAK